MQILQNLFVLNKTLETEVIEIGDLERYIDIDICQWSGRCIELVQTYNSVGKELVDVFIHRKNKTLSIRVERETFRLLKRF